MGERVDTIRYLLANYKYESANHVDLKDTMVKSLFNKDSEDNNCLHYSYMIDVPEVRQILRDNGLM